jgi:hypothetical protein
VEASDDIKATVKLLDLRIIDNWREGMRWAGKSEPYSNRQGWALVRKYDPPIQGTLAQVFCEMPDRMIPDDAAWRELLTQLWPGLDK